MRTLSVTDAEYVADYKIRLTFTDGTSQVVDFGPFLMNHPQHDKYRRIANFKRFHLEWGNIVWGKDWDLIFPISQLHHQISAVANWSPLRFTTKHLLNEMPQTVQTIKRKIDKLGGIQVVNENEITYRYVSKQDGQLDLFD